MQQHRKIRLLMVLIYIAFAFAFRIMFLPSDQPDAYKPDLTGNLMINLDVTAEILGAKSIIDGSFDLYTRKYFKEVVPPDGGVIGYPPLMFYVQVPIVLTGMLLGLEPLGMGMIIACGFPYIILGALCALCAGVVLKRCLHVADEMTVTAAVFLLLFSSLMFWVTTYSARFDFAATLLLLLAMTKLKNERYGWTGILLGLAVMTKQTVLPAVVVFLAVILMETLRKEIGFRKTVRLLAAMPLPLAILIPFLITSPRGLWNGFFVTPSMLIIMKGTFINGLLEVGKFVFEEEALREFLKVHSNSIIFASCIVLVTAVTVKKNIRSGSSQFCALIALASFFCMLLAKNAGISRHAVLPSVFVVLWGASRKPGFPYVALWFVVLQSFILDHVPVLWKQHVGLIFYACACVYMYYVTFAMVDENPVAPEHRESNCPESDNQAAGGVGDKSLGA